LISPGPFEPSCGVASLTRPSLLVEPWESTDDLTLIMRTLMTMDAKLDVIGDFVVAIWNTLEDDEEEEEEG
jgi:hypothetical protein